MREKSGPSFPEPRESATAHPSIQVLVNPSSGEFGHSIWIILVWPQTSFPSHRSGAPSGAPHTPAFKLSLRLLPAIIMDNDEDDDGNFTKWMSSYWGHGAGEESAKERKRSFRRPARKTADRRASLPCMSQLEAMRVKQLHAATMPPAPVHLKNREEKEVRPHPHARRVSSDESSRTKAGPESRISTIPELAESFERMLRFRNQKVMSLNDADSVCLICHEEMCNGGGGVGGAYELHCSHRFHKECIEEWMWSQGFCPTCSVYVVMPELLYWSSGRLQFP